MATKKRRRCRLDILAASCVTRDEDGTRLNAILAAAMQPGKSRELFRFVSFRLEIFFFFSYNAISNFEQ